MALLQNVIARGTHAARPAAGSTGVVYLETDTGLAYRDNGSSWDLLTTAPAFSWATKTSAYTLTSSDTGILADATSGAFTLTLPTAVGATARYSIKKKDTSSNAITIAGTSSQTIDGATTLTLTSPGSTLDLVSDGSNWYGAGGPRGRIGYAQITADQTTTSTSAVDLSTLTCTVTVGSRPLRITVFSWQVYHSVAGSRVFANIYDSTAAAAVQNAWYEGPYTTAAPPALLVAQVAPAAGSRTYKVQWGVIDAGTGTWRANTDRPSFLLVEEI